MPGPSVTCSWCRFYYEQRPPKGTCDNCGGPLPPPAGADRGAGPPPAPRTLPAAYRRSVLVSRNVLTILGLVFLPLGGSFFLVSGITALAGAIFVLPLVFGALGLVFSAVGGPLLAFGLRSGRRKLAALEHGVPAEGRITSVSLNTSVRINGRSPWAIAFAFPVGRGEVEGKAQSFAPHDGERKAGDPVWVVYLAADPSTSTIWPPIG